MWIGNIAGVREFLRRILLFFQCFFTFSRGGVRFYKDAIRYSARIKEEPQVHHVCYKGRNLYYRTNTTDIILIVCILVKRVQYNISFGGVEPEGVLDCGANIGLFTFKFADSFPKTKFIAVEPEEENYRILQMNLGQFGNVETVKAGVWWRKTNLNIIDGGTGSWAFRVEESEKEGLNAMSLDDLCHEYGVKASIIKMDIEGSEKIVFQHIDECNWISDTKIFICETHDVIMPGSDQIVKENMREYGFKWTKMGENLIFSK